MVTKIVFYILSSKFFRPKSTKSSKFICLVSAESSKSYRNLNKVFSANANLSEGLNHYNQNMRAEVLELLKKA